MYVIQFMKFIAIGKRRYEFQKRTV